MNYVAAAHPQAERTLIDSFDEEFARLHARACRLINTTPDKILYRDPNTTMGEATFPSIGACALRSAGAVEQTFGGITSNLWDDPFEWTLPETLSSCALIIEYLTEVEKTRKHAFGCFVGDADLLKKIATPSGEMQTLIDLLQNTLARARVYQERATAVHAMLSK